jgi:hypothetical protein
MLASGLKLLVIHYFSLRICLLFRKLSLDLSVITHPVITDIRHPVITDIRHPVITDIRHPVITDIPHPVITIADSPPRLAGTRPASAPLPPSPSAQQLVSLKPNALQADSEEDISSLERILRRAHSRLPAL